LQQGRIVFHHQDPGFGLFHPLIPYGSLLINPFILSRRTPG